MKSTQIISAPLIMLSFIEEVKSQWMLWEHPQNTPSLKVLGQVCVGIVYIDFIVSRIMTILWVYFLKFVIYFINSLVLISLISYKSAWY